MRKLFFALILIVFLLLSALYLALNSPYVIDKVARKFAPEYHFSYERIEGDPLKGIVLQNLYYKDRRLARRIRIRVNPYTLLQKRLTISRLDLLDVNVKIVEQMIHDFSSPSKQGGGERESESTLPLAIEAKKIHLSLLPFKRYGVAVEKEELHIDSIYYEKGVFNVGKLHQIAQSSLGTVELEGTYHQRFLDVEMLVLKDLDLMQMEKFLKSIGAWGEGTEVNGSSTPEAHTRKGVADEKVEDPFLPVKIHAKKLRVTLKPYHWEKNLHLDWARAEGRDLKIDLKKRRLTGGEVAGNVHSNLGNARFQIHFDSQKAILEEGYFESIDLQKILAFGSHKQKEMNGSQEAGKRILETKKEELEPLEKIPFVPSDLLVKRLRVELRAGRLEGVDYRHAIFSIKDLHADLHRNSLELKKLRSDLDTPLMHLHLDASIEEKTIRIHSLQAQDMDFDALRRYLEVQGREKKASQPAASTRKDDKASQKSSRGMRLPLLPSIVVLEEGKMIFKPFVFDTLKVEKAQSTLKKIHFDLRSFLMHKGGVELDLKSNFSNIRIKGKVQENRLLLTAKQGGEIRLRKKLFESFGIPLRVEAFSPIHVEGGIDAKALHLRAAFNARRILADQNSSFNMDIPHSLTTVNFDFLKSLLDVEHESRIAIPQAPQMHLKAKFFQKKGATPHYHALLNVGHLTLGNQNIEKMLGIPKITVEGDLHSLRAKLDAGIFGGTFLTGDFKEGTLRLGTKRSLKLAEYFKMPKELRASRVEFETITPINFTKLFPVQSNLALHSNLANLDGTLRYDGNLSTRMIVHFPPKSLLSAFLPKLKLHALKPLEISLQQAGDLWKGKLKNKIIGAAMQYALKRDRIEGVINVAGTEMKVGGKLRKTVRVTLHSSSVKKLMRNLGAVYTVEIPQLDGDLDLDLKIDQLRRATLELRSKKFIPDDTARIKSPIKNLRLLLRLDKQKQLLLIESYQMEVAGMKIFSSKPSMIRLEKERIVLDSLWINDSLNVTGEYDLQRKKGKILAKSSRFKIDHENAKLDAAVDILVKIEDLKIDAKGKITLLGGDVMYNLEAKHYATDEDIVILQHRKKNKVSFFRKNLRLNLYIEAKAPLLFKQKNLFVELKPQLSLLKEFDSDLQLLGSISLAKGGYYIFEGKRFILQPSSVNFTGKPTQPLLDIHLFYQRHAKTIYITLSGKASEPNLNFSSDPSMNRNQILSFLLFDSEDSGKDAGDMLSMVGGGIAKSILGNLGLKVDTLILNSSGFEVGKQITDRISILYDQGEESKIIVRVKTFKHTQTDITIGEESQSVDIIYKREF